ncbi:hypothetical protein CCAX7_46670 [Capsulimonas corticalis]|uniref:Uncharacterized protein n=1 Tax=Capsulimonas corticalis TaxID=2219043 RepID=A0A402CQW3_9BACT|nr:Crp/Fnr family transcriptional regulator [Capsulimonas corticalis]BDI32616.1 hypothetical protein CCAX7_46670 [Capsulimonas corticalis]
MSETFNEPKNSVVSKRRLATIREPVGEAAKLSDLSEKLLEDVDQTILESLLQHCRICYLEPAQYLHLVRKHRRFIYVLRKGYVTVSLKTKENEPAKFLAWRKPGQLLGEMEALYPDTDTISARLKATDKCELLEIPSKILINIADNTPAIYRNVCSLLIEKNFEHRRRADVLKLRTPLDRVRATLIHLRRERGYELDNKTIKGNIRPQDIAGFIGEDPDRVTPKLDMLVEEGSIEYINSDEMREFKGKRIEGKKIKIRNEKLLSEK